MLIYRKAKASSISERKQDIVLSCNDKTSVPKQNAGFCSFGVFYRKNGTQKKHLKEVAREEITNNFQSKREETIVDFQNKEKYLQYLRTADIEDKKHEEITEAIVQYLEGNTLKIEEILGKTRNQIFWSIFEIVRNMSLAEDLTQEALLVIYKEINNYKFRYPKNPVGWFITIGRNIALNYLNKREKSNELVNWIDPKEQEKYDCSPSFLKKNLPKEENNLKGVSRIDQPNTKWHCWWVRLGYETSAGSKRTKPKIQKSFSDTSYGGKEEALKAAVEFRDEQIKNLPLNEREAIFKWKNRDRKTRREIQENIGFKTVKVGIGIEGAKKAYELGASEVTVFKIRTGRQDTFTTNKGGWHVPRFEDKEFKREVTAEDEKKIRNLVNLESPQLADVEKSEIVGEILICQSINDKPMTDTNMKRMIRKYQGYFEKRKNQTDKRLKYVGNYDNYSLYEEEDLEREYL